MNGPHPFIQPLPVQFAGFSGPDMQDTPIRGALGELFDPMQPGLTSCICGGAEAGGVLHGERNAARRGEVVVLSMYSDAAGLLTIELSEDGQSWLPGAWFGVKADKEAVLRFVPSAAWWRPVVTSDDVATLVCVSAQSRIF